MTTPNTASHLGNLYRRALLENIIPFWERHSPDREYGGYFTCLGRSGEVFDTDKFVWLQARQVWTFSHLYNTVEAKDDWLEIARLGVEFLARYARAENGSFYYALTREGAPLSQPWNIFTDGFAAMGFAEYARASQNSEAAEIALATYHRFLERKPSPKGCFAKGIPGARPLENLALRMIHLNLLLVFNGLLDESETRDTASLLIDEILNIFRHPELDILLENVTPEGGVSDTFEGRAVNPGHGLEVLWMALAAAVRWEREDAVAPLVQRMLATAAYGWDAEHGGLFYRLDIMDKPPLLIEWDRKMWWVHAEAIIAFSLAYRYTRSAKALVWLERVHEYTWKHFVDQEYGEWYGYLSREGKVLLNLKGNRWKGCFHVPRALLWANRALGETTKKSQTDNVVSTR